MIDLNKSKWQLPSTPILTVIFTVVLAIAIGIISSCTGKGDTVQPQVLAAMPAVQAASAPDAAASSGFSAEGAPGCIEPALDMKIETATKICWGKPTSITENASKQDDGKGGTIYVDEETWTYKETGDRPDSYITFCGGFLCTLVNHIDPNGYGH